MKEKGFSSIVCQNRSGAVNCISVLFADFPDFIIADHSQVNLLKLLNLS